MKFTPRTVTTLPAYAIVETFIGYAKRGPANLVFSDLAARYVLPGERVVVFFGSRNDYNQSVSQINAGIQDAFRAVKQIAPAARLLVIGPPWVTATPPPGVLQARDILRTRTEEAGETFVDPIAEGWLLDSPGLIGSDGVHPTDAGHVYLADKIAPLIAAQLEATQAG